MSSAALCHQKPLLLLSSRWSPSQAQPAASEKQDVEADAFKRHSALAGVAFIPPSNSAYSLFPALNVFAGLSIGFPWESLFLFFFSLSLKVFCDPFGPGDLQHHEPPMLFGEAGLAVAASRVCISRVGSAVPSVQGDMWPLLLLALFLVIPQK